MDLEEIGVEFRRIDRTWATKSRSAKRIDRVRLGQLEHEVASEYGGADRGAPDLVRAIRVLIGKIEHAITMDRDGDGR